MNTRILVWDLPTRVFHWSLVLSFIIAYITAESDRLLGIHLISGYILLALTGFRLAWGLVGSRHARFANFVRGPAAIGRYLSSLLRMRPEHHVGHNPAGAVAIVLLLGLGIATTASGWLALGNFWGEFFEEIHEAAASVMLAMVFVHVAGVTLASRLHQENLVAAMISGYKTGQAEEAIPRRHGVVAILLVATIVGLGWSLAQGKLPALYDPATMELKSDKHHD